MKRELFSFTGGIRFDDYHKRESTRQAVVAAPLPARLVLPLHQHIGEGGEALVQPGDKVLKGQPIARAVSYVSAPLHAPTSGTVVKVGDEKVPHPSGLSAPCIVIEPDGEDTWAPRQSHARDYAEMNPSALRNLIREAGIVGLGGAGFPSYVKLNPGHNPVETLILNGAECEPFITCDDMLMRQRADEIVKGSLIIRHALGARQTLIAIEDNKPEAIAAMRGAVQRLAPEHTEVVSVPTLYPAGGEKQLIYTLTGKEVPSDGLPVHIGVVCQNVATTGAIFRAVYHGEPLLSRWLTVTGGVAEPRNLEVLLGTPVDELIRFCGGKPERCRRIIMGGPMMGFALHAHDLPVIKTTNCILVDDGRQPDLAGRQYAMPCIRCGACADACPVRLLPQQLYWYAQAGEFDRCQEYHLFDCIECGCCDYVCPAHLPLVQYYRYAKGEIWKRERERQQAELARERHEFRLFRLEREKKERAAKRQQKKAALAKETSAQGDAQAKQAAIQAALERVKAKKARQTRENTPPEQGDS